MDRLDLLSNQGLRSYFVGLGVKCPSAHCDGTLDEYEQEAWEPFKAFLVCTTCESRLRIHKAISVPRPRPIVVGG